MSEQYNAPTCVIVIGASNVTRSTPTIMQCLVERIGGAGANVRSRSRTDIVLVGGHGRSYGLPTTVLGRHLPSIIDCRLWHDLPRIIDDRQCAAVFSDIGNDIMYGVRASTIVEWVTACVVRLAPFATGISLVLPPIERLREVSPGRYRLLSSMLFPRSTLSHTDALHGVERLTSTLAAQRWPNSLTLVRSERRWYGFDPIHIARRQQRVAWSTILEPLGPRLNDVATPWIDRIRARLARPADATMLGVSFGKPQPSTRFGAGMRLWKY